MVKQAPCGGRPVAIDGSARKSSLTNSSLGHGLRSKPTRNHALSTYHLPAVNKVFKSGAARRERTLFPINVLEAVIHCSTPLKPLEGET